MAVKHAESGRQLLENLKAIARRHGKFLLKTLLQDVGDLHYLRVAVSLAQYDSRKRHPSYSSSRQVRAEFDVSTLLEHGDPLPLVMFDSPCLMRTPALACLDRAGIPWRIVFVSHSLSGIWAAVQAGLGITVRTRVGMPGNLRVTGSILPSPGNLGITLQQGRRNEANADARTVLGHLMEQALLSVK